MSYILAQRTDGLGSRINAILNAMFLANELGGLENFKFIYTSRSNEKNLKSFESNEIVRGSCDDLSSIFDNEFIKNHYLNIKELEGKSLIEVTKYKDMKSLKEAFTKGDYEFFYVPVGFLHWYIQDIDFGYYRKQTTLMFFEKIAFEKKIKQVIKKAQKKALNLGDYVSIHYRSGDGIYGYSSISRLTGKFLINFCSYFELILAVSLRVLSKGERVVVIGDDQTSIANLKLQDARIFPITEFRNINEYSNAELFFYDLLLLSYAQTLYWSGSALCKISYLINPKIKLIQLQNVFGKEKLYELVKYYHARNNLSNYQKAYSLFHLYLLAKEFKEDLGVILGYLSACLELDYENDKYRIYTIEELLLAHQFKKAEEFLRITLELRKEQFIQTLSNCYPTPDNFIYKECFENYLKINDYKEYPCLYFVATYLMKNCYKKEVQRADINLISIFESFRPSLENETSSAKTRIHNHLAYRLGSLMIRNSKSFLGYMKMPYLLMTLTLIHKEEQKLYKEKIKTYPNLALPPLETYKDYKEALKEKECFTYKLGEAFIKAHKNWYGGGYLRFFFKELPRLKREFKNKED